jgi:hypothetical protein
MQLRRRYSVLEAALHEGTDLRTHIAFLEENLSSAVQAALPLCARHSVEIAEGGTVDSEDSERREGTARAFLQVAGIGELVLRRLLEGMRGELIDGTHYVKELFAGLNRALDTGRLPSGRRLLDPRDAWLVAADALTAAAPALAEEPLPGPAMGQAARSVVEGTIAAMAGAWMLGDWSSFPRG